MADTSATVSHKRFNPGWMALALAATLLVVGLMLGHVSERLDYIVYDKALVVTDRAPPDDIVIVEIDNRSIEAIGRWPWPRSIHAQALERLAEAKPRSVGYNVLFIDPSPDDAALADAVGRNRTFLPLDIVVPGPNGAPYEIAPPAGPIAAAAAGIAHVNLQFGDDRVVRQAYLQEGDGKRAWVELGAAMAGLKPVKGAGGTGELLKERPILIPYGGGIGHFRTVSFVDLLDGQIMPELFANHHVLVGATANGLSPSYATPKSGEVGQMSGVEIEAHLLDGLLRGQEITPASTVWQFVLALAAVWIPLLGILRLRPRGIAIMTVAMTLGIIALTFGLLRFAHIWVPPITALAGLIFVISIEAWRERVRLRETLVRERISAAATEGELQAGRNIQLGMLPPRADLAKIDPRLDVDALLEPAKSIGGDLFDVIRIDKDRIAFVVGDVTGKGVPAALFMALSKALTKSVVLRGLPDLAEAAFILNEELMRDNSESMNVTMLVGIMDLTSGELMMMSAGHEHPLLVRVDGSVVTHELDGGPPFCIVDFPYPEEPMKLAPGETLVLISDGVSEALNGKSELFGHDRLLAAIAGKTTATAMIESVRDAVRVFEDGTDPTDDLTVMAVRYLGETATPA